MAVSKFLVISFFYSCMALHSNPHTEYYEILEAQRASRRESPRHIRSGTNAPTAQQSPERLCWGFLSCFADLMQYASNSSPYIYMSRRQQ